MKKHVNGLFVLTFGALMLTVGCQTEVGGNREGVPAPLEAPTPEAEVDDYTVTTTTIVTPEKPLVTPTYPTAQGGGAVGVPYQPVAEIPPFEYVPTAQSVYVVKKGDSLWLIAHAHGVSVGELLASNPALCPQSVLNVVSEVVIPAGGACVRVVEREDVKPEAG